MRDAREALPAARSRSAPGRRWAWWQVGGLVLAAVLLAVRWGLADRMSSLPPGLLLLLGAAVALVLRRGPTTVTAGLGVAALVLVVLLVNAGPGFFTGAGGPLRVGLRWLELVALLAASTAGAAQLLHVRGAGAERRPPEWCRYAQVAGLLVLAPVGAEYLAAYDDTTGDAPRLLLGLLVLVPLYGCPALLIREVARRNGRGYGSMVLLATGYGLVQAGLVDQSLFNPGYRGIEGWSEEFRATLVGPLGVSASHALSFVSGHVVYSICAPIAVVESGRTRSATTPWLGRPALVVLGLLWLAASAAVLSDHLASEEFRASPAQLVGTGALVVGLVVLALRTPARPRRPALHRAPPALVVLLLSGVLSLVYGWVGATWTGTGLMAAALLLAAAGLLLGSGTTGWGARQVGAAAAAPLVVRAVLAFTYDPVVGEVGAAAKYGHNLVMLALTLALAVLVLTRRGRGVDLTSPS